MWTKQKSTIVQTFQWNDEPELKHFIRTGFDIDGPLAWIVVNEDAYELELGRSNIMSTKEIFNKYNIDLNDTKR
jgi:hypothetical protein